MPKRWVVERSFAWLNGYRILSKEYEQTLLVTRAVLQIACIRKNLKGTLFNQNRF
ncbi:MAG: transposase [Kiritimatiellae bacterium]|nr:transposase [Kiritimatiellia bacterium]